MKILLATDGSPCSEAAVNEISRHPWPTDSVVRVIHAIEPLSYIVPEAGIMSPSYFEVVETEAREAVSRAVSTLEKEARTQLKIESTICAGYPKRVILDEAESWGADLIVVGSHGRGLAGRFLLGSVSQSVTLHAECSVLVVREKKARSGGAAGEEQSESGS